MNGRLAWVGCWCEWEAGVSGDWCEWEVTIDGRLI